MNQETRPELSTGSNNGGAHQSVLDQEVDLLIYLKAILSVKYRIVVLAVIGAALSLAATFLIDKTYMASVVTAINIDEKPGGVAPKDYRSGDTIGLLERDFLVQAAAANERDRIMARMRSAKFSEVFLTENKLMPYIFYKLWNAEKSKWLDDEVPDIREGVKIFQENLRVIELDEKTGLLIVHFKTRDPELSAKLANLFVNRFNRYIKDNALEELSERRRYLESRLKEGTNLELQRSIFRLLETQLAAETLIHARNTFPLETIQPANPPLGKLNPKRLLTAALTFVGLMFIGVTFVLGRLVFRNIKQGLDNISNHSELAETNGSSTTNSTSSWVDS